MLRRSNERVHFISKGYQASLIITAHSNVRQNQRSIDTIVEKSHSSERLLHNTPLIDNREYLLRTFVMIDIHHQLIATCTCLPVYTSVFIALHIVFYLLKLSVVTCPTYTLYTHLCEIIAYRKKFIAIEHHIRRIDLNVFCIAQSITTFDKSQDSTCETTNLTKRIDATLHWSERITNRILSHRC